MYRRKEEQKEMLTVCEKYLNVIYDLYHKKELDDLSFLSRCSFVCGLIYATLGDCEKYELMEELIKIMEELIKLLIDTYHSVGGADNEKE